MAEMLNSKDSFILVRKWGEAVDADKFMYMTEWGIDHERDSDAESTFEGTYVKGGSVETVFSGTAKMIKNDELSYELEDALLDGTRYEVWEINRTKPGTGENEGKYYSRYMQGYWSKFGLKGEVDEIEEYETEFGAEGRMKRGYATLPGIIEQNKADYGFHEPIKSDPADENLVAEEIPQPAAA